MDSDLRRLFDTGMTFGEIGREMGVTRNSAISRAHRIKLPRRGPIVAMARKPKPRVHKRQRFREVPPMPAELCPRPVNSRPPGPLAAAECITSGECGCDNAVPIMQGCTLMELSESTCRWPLWNDAQPERLYCGAAHVHGSPYCGIHTKRAWR